MIFFRARLIRPGIVKGGDEWQLVHPTLLSALDFTGLPIRYGHAPADPIGTVVSAEVADDCAIDSVLQMWERPRVRACSLGGEITVQHRPGRWTGKPFDAVITAFDLDHLALVERGLFPGCEIGDEVAVDAAMDWPQAGPTTWNTGATAPQT